MPRDVDRPGKPSPLRCGCYGKRHHGGTTLLRGGREEGRRVTDKPKADQPNILTTSFHHALMPTSLVLKVEGPPSLPPSIPPYSGKLCLILTYYSRSDIRYVETRFLWTSTAKLTVTVLQQIAQSKLQSNPQTSLPTYHPTQSHKYFVLKSLEDN